MFWHETLLLLGVSINESLWHDCFGIFRLTLLHLFENILIRHLLLLYQGSRKKVFFLSGQTTKGEGERVRGCPLWKKDATYPNIDICVLCCRSANSQYLTGFFA